MEDLIAVRVGEAEIHGFHDQLARFFCFLGLHVHAADALSPLGALLTHGNEIAHASHVPGAAGLDALADPDFLLGQLLVEGCVFLFLVLKAQIAAGQIVVKAAVVAVKMAAVYFHDARGQIAGEGAVMADEDQRACALDEKVLKPGDGFDIEVVGGFVEEEIVRREKGPGQGHPALAPA